MSRSDYSDDFFCSELVVSFLWRFWLFSLFSCTHWCRPKSDIRCSTTSSDTLSRALRSRAGRGKWERQYLPWESRGRRILVLRSWDMWWSWRHGELWLTWSRSRIPLTTWCCFAAFGRFCNSRWRIWLSRWPLLISGRTSTAECLRRQLCSNLCMCSLCCWCPRPEKLQGRGRIFTGLELGARIMAFLGRLSTSCACDRAFSFWACGEEISCLLLSCRWRCPRSGRGSNTRISTTAAQIWNSGYDRGISGKICYALIAILSSKRQRQRWRCRKQSLSRDRLCPEMNLRSRPETRSDREWPETKCRGLTFWAISSACSCRESHRCLHRRSEGFDI